jgi:hypothetical protein
MLVPDLSPLKQGLRPDKWTYRERRWLDALVHEIESGTSAAVEDLLQAWGISIPGPGRMPQEQRPTVWLTVPFVPSIMDGDGRSPALHVFLSEEAARLFFEGLKIKNEDLRSFSFREVRRTKLQGNGDGYLIAYDVASLGAAAELHLHQVRDGRDHVSAAVGFCPSEKNGPSHGLLWFQLPGLNLEAVFVFSHAR